MATESDPVIFDRASARRIAKRTKAAERHPERVIGDVARNGNPQQETVYARLSTYVTASKKWEWDQVQRVSDGTWENVPNGRKGRNASDPKLLAFEIRPSGAKSGSVVVLRRCPVKTAGTPPTWSIEWAIISYITPLLWGTVSTIWSAGTNVIVVTPTLSDGTPTGEADVNVTVELPVTSNAQFCAYGAGEIVAYLDMTGDGTDFILFRNKLPQASLQYQGFYNNATDGSPPNIVVDFLRAV